MMRRVLALCVLLALVGIACEEPPATEPVARGRQLFRKLDCARCHFIDGQGGRIAPDLTHIGTVAATRRPGTTAEAYIRQSLVDPGAYIVSGFSDVMPRGQTRNLSQADMDALILFLTDHR